MSDLGKIITNVIQDYDDSNLDTMIIEQSDMVVSTTRKIVNKYIDTNNVNQTGDNVPIYIIRELGYNSSNELIYIKVIDKTTEPPTWVPSNLW